MAATDESDEDTERRPGMFELLLGEGWVTSGDGIYRRVEPEEPRGSAVGREARSSVDEDTPSEAFGGSRR